ncbi:hypothetical protein D8S78_15115 [Natrialba swarupiae]|nr:hypothetical protein [Natrialba swarupiae]
MDLASTGDVFVDIGTQNGCAIDIESTRELFVDQASGKVSGDCVGTETIDCSAGLAFARF